MPRPFLRRYLQPLLLLGLGLVGGVLLGFGLWSKTPLFPSHYETMSYGDDFDKGHSQMASVDMGDSLRLEWRFREGFAYPYAGVNWSLENEDGCADLSNYRAIDVHMKSAKHVTFTVKVIEALEGWSKIGAWETYRPRLVRLWYGQGVAETQRIPIENFAVPDWWYVDYPTAPHPGQSAHSVCRIGLTFDGPVQSGGSAIVYGLSLRGDARMVRLGSALLGLSSVLFFFWLYREVRRARREVRQLQHRLEVQAAIQAPPIDPDKDWKSIRAALESKWNDPELQMGVLTDATGIPSYRIATIIKEKTGLSFKAMLNQIRLEKAEQMLVGSEEQVAQVALLCGYGNIAHFYRVFKQRHNLSPGDWRLKAREEGRV